MSKMYNSKEMENMFEIGRQVQYMVDEEEIDVEDSVNAYWFALELSAKFEEEYPDTDDYYADLYEFMYDKILARFGVKK